MYYPIMLNIQGKSCYIIGGGAVALRKVKGLLQCGAKIKVISPALCAELDSLFSQGNMEWIKDIYSKNHLKKCVLCFACTDSSDVNLQILKDCEELGILASICDGGAAGDFVLPAVRRKGDGTLGVYSSDNPAASRFLADYIIKLIPEWLTEYIRYTGSLRSAAKKLVPDRKKRQDFMKLLFNTEFIELAASDFERTREKAESLLGKLQSGEDIE